MRFSTLTTAVAAVLFSLGLFGCGGAYVADIAGDKISVQEFEHIYAKNSNSKESAQKATIEDKEKFLDLYTKFRLKVKEAKALGYDKDPEIVSELADYRKNLAVSYMLEKELTGPALQKLYNRKLQEVRASHILIRLPQNASPADTAKAFAVAQKIIDSLKSGVSFETLALHNSQDPSAQYNKGDLYYFSGGLMVPEFEDAVYSLKPGEFSQTPVRTQFGYHVIKVTDIHPNQKAVHVSHIMKRLSQNSSQADSAAAEKQLLGIRDSVLNGGNFGDYAMKYSDDTYSAQRGGDLGFIDRGRTVREFDDAIFKMKDGEVSNIVRTQFGLHLIKRFTAQGVGSFKDVEQDLKTEYQRNRFQHDYDIMVEKMKSLYHFVMDSSAFNEFAANADTLKSTGDESWDSTYTPAVRALVVFTYGGQKATIGDVIAAVKTNQELKNLPLKDPATFKKIADKIGTSLVVEFHARTMENTFPDFAQTMKEYEDGILLFKAEQENVWNKVVPTDSALHAYYSENHAKYTWPDRVNFQEIFVASDSMAGVIKKALTGYTIDSLVVKKTKRRTKKPLYDTLKIAVAPLTFDSAAVVYNKRGSTIHNRGIWGLQPVASELTKRAWDETSNDTTNYFPNDGGFSFIKVLQKDPAREKTFEEAQSELSGAFQESETKRIESIWYDSLKKKYPVVINKEALAQTFSSSQPAPAKQ